MEAVGLLTQLIPSIQETRKACRSLETFEENPIPAALHAYQKKN